MKQVKPVFRNCDNCEFNFGSVCAGHGSRIDNGQDTYGMPIDSTKSMFPSGCDDFWISFECFIECFRC